jgi:hypothetical protein
MDNANQCYAPIPPGYQWNVEYYRCEDGTLSTNPALAKLPPNEHGPRKKIRLNDFAVSRYLNVLTLAITNFQRRSMAVKKEDLTFEGIEDISSDEELYIKDDRVSEDNFDNVGSESSIVALQDSRPPVRQSQNSISFIPWLYQPPEAPPASGFSAASTLIIAPLTSRSGHSYGLCPSIKEKRIHCQYQSVSVTNLTEEDDSKIEDGVRDEEVAEVPFAEAAAEEGNDQGEVEGTQKYKKKSQ